MPDASDPTRPIRQLARYEVRESALRAVRQAIDEFVAWIRANEPWTLRYDVWQEHGDPTRFVHIFTFRDRAAHEAHSASPEVKRFAGILYPQCLAPVEFVDYDLVASNAEDVAPARATL